jgi:hypothetical protein
MSNEKNDFVKLAKCRFCGKDTGAILLHKQLREIKDEEAFDQEPCKDCKDKFKDHKFFFARCGHSGFILEKAFTKIMPKEFVKQVGKGKIFEMEKCYMCLGLIKKEDVKYF